MVASDEKTEHSKGKMGFEERKSKWREYEKKKRTHQEKKTLKLKIDSISKFHLTKSPNEPSANTLLLTSLSSTATIALLKYSRVSSLHFHTPSSWLELFFLWWKLKLSWFFRYVSQFSLHIQREISHLWFPPPYVHTTTRLLDLPSPTQRCPLRQKRFRCLPLQWTDEMIY